MLLLQDFRALNEAAVRAVPLQVGPVGKCDIQVRKLRARASDSMTSLRHSRRAIRQCHETHVRLLRGNKLGDVVVVGGNEGHSLQLGKKIFNRLCPMWDKVALGSMRITCNSYLFLGQGCNRIIKALLRQKMTREEKTWKKRSETQGKICLMILILHYDLKLSSSKSVSSGSRCANDGM